MGCLWIARILICLPIPSQPSWRIRYVFSRGKRTVLASRVTDCAMCQKLQCLKGSKEPVCLRYFHAVEHHMGRTHIHTQTASGRSTADIRIKEWPCAGHQRPPVLQWPPRGKGSFVFTPRLFLFLFIASHARSFLHDTSAYANRTRFFSAIELGCEFKSYQRRLSQNII